MKKIFIILVVLAMIFTTFGCQVDNSQNNTNDENNNTDNNVNNNNNNNIVNDEPEIIEITDSNGTVFEFDSYPKRVVSTGPNITEIIFALDKGNLLVGRTSFCDYPLEVSQIDDIGTLQEPNIEKIISLEPDVVIASTHFSEESTQILSDLGIKVVIFYESESFEGAFEMIENIGKLLGADEKALEVVSEMKEKVEYVKTTLEGTDKESVYYVVGFGEYGDWTATGDTFIHQLLEMAGGDNIAKDGEGWSYSLEKLVENDPQFIIASSRWDTVENFSNAENYKDLTAVINGNIYGIDENMIVRQGPRLADGLLEIAKILHPDKFK